MTSLLPTTRLIACPGCRELTRLEEIECPHCGALLRGPEGRRLAAAALAIGIAVSGCADEPKDPTSGSEVAGLYGTPTTMDTAGSTDTTGATESTGATSGFEVTGLYGTPTTASEASSSGGSTDATGTGSSGGTLGAEPEAATPPPG